MDKIILITQGELETLIQNAVRSSLQGINPLGKKTKDFISIDEAAEFLELAKATLYAMVSKRRIPFYKNGKRLYFKQSELSEWLLSAKHKSVSELMQDLEAGKDIVASKR